MIIYFTGNGNSEAIAVALSQKLNEPLLQLKGKLLLEPQNQTVKAEGDRIIWVFPVYSWGIPPVVVNFMKHCNLTGAEKACHHMVVTCGDDTGLVATQWRKLMKARRWNTASASSVIMPNTYVLMKGFDTDKPELEHEKLESATKTIEDIAKRIESGTNEDAMTKGSFAWFKSKIIYPWFKKYAMSPKPFHTNSECTLCGKCARECPMENITIVDGKVEWQDHCALCLRCYHRCPSRAIAYGKATTGKHQYKGPHKAGL